ncbi:MAG: putative metalloprotease CJM1_0395 family protein [Alphaproteobacteria bacterium]
MLSGETRLASQQAGAPSAEPRAAAPSAGTEALTEEEKKKVQELQSRDREVRAHEQAHKAAGGPHAGSPTFKTVRGPDGRSYAVSGEVKIDTSAVPNNPDATIRKMEQIKRAALAPSNPSSADRQVAAEADAKIQKARLEKREMEAEEREKAAGNGTAPGTIDKITKPGATLDIVA